MALSLSKMAASVVAKIERVGSYSKLKNTEFFIDKRCYWFNVETCR